MVPGIGTIQGFWASSQASAIWAGVAFFACRDLTEQIDQRLVGFARFRREARHDVAEVGGLSNCVFCVDGAGEEALAQRAEGDEADAEFFERGQDLLFGLAPPERVLALQGGDGLHGVGAADGLRAGFGQAEVLHLAFLDQVL